MRSDALKAYEKAWSLASSVLPSSHYLRLGAGLSLARFYASSLSDKQVCVRDSLLACGSRLSLVSFPTH